MKKRIIAAGLCPLLLLCGCGNKQSESEAQTEKTGAGYSVFAMNNALLEAAHSLPQSNALYFEEGLEITGLGVTYDGRPTSFGGCYYLPAIEK